MSTLHLTASILGTLSPEPAPPSPETKRRLAQLRTNVSLKQKILLLSVWIFSAFFGLAFCFPEKVINLIQCLINLKTIITSLVS